MDKRIQFQEKLAGILALAKSKDKRITTEEAEQYFTKEHLNEEQMLLVYDYLLSQKIIVSGYVKKEQAAAIKEPTEDFYSTEEQTYLEEYQRELDALKEIGEEELEQAFLQAADGDAMAKSSLVEAYLPVVVEIAKTLHTKEMFIGDLVQEGNVSLMLAVDALADSIRGDEIIRQEVHNGIQAFLEEQKELKIQDSKMVEQVNRLDEGIRSLGEDLGRKVSVEELAVFMDMEEAEILDVLKLAGEELEEE